MNSRGARCIHAASRVANVVLAAGVDKHIGLFWSAATAANDGDGAPQPTLYADLSSRVVGVVSRYRRRVAQVLPRPERRAYMQASSASGAGDGLGECSMLE